MKENIPADRQIIQEVLQGKREAFAEIVRKYQRGVLGYCRCILKDRQLAEDAAQETFIKAYKALASFRNNSSFATWLFRIAGNHCKDILKSPQHKREDSLVEMKEAENESTESSYFAKQEIARVFSALPDHYRDIIILRELNGMSYQEISEVLQCSLDAVKSMLKRARKELEVLVEK